MEVSNSQLQGSFLSIFGLGTLITGEPGIGKSELALALISRGHRFIADDAPKFTLQAGSILGSNPLSQPFLHLRGLGIFDIYQLYGPGLVQACGPLQLIIELQNTDSELFTDPIMGLHCTKDIAGCLIPSVTIPIIIPRKLEVLVEIIVKRHLSLIYQHWTTNTPFEPLLQHEMEHAAS